MNIIYSRQASKFLDKQNIKTKKQIVEAINRIPDGDIKPLKGASDVYRLRKRTFRILFKIEGKDLRISVIDNRGDVY